MMMMTTSTPIILILIILLLAMSPALQFEMGGSSSEGFTTMVLEKEPSLLNMTSEGLILIDKARHRRMLRRSSSSSSAAAATRGTVGFSVEGESDPYTARFHFTRVKLGSPPREFHLRIDTSSNIMWVNCNPCTGCPTTTELGFELGSFDPSKSSSASVVSCTDSLCDSSGCNSNSQCSYTSPPEIGSSTSGFYVSDVISFDKLIRGSKTVSSSANIVFGCSDYHSGFATQTSRAVDGVFGLGPHRRSVISQLAALGSTPNAFAHCLKAGDTGGAGGGTLVLGEVIEPRMTYTPLVPFQSYYSLSMVSISIGGQTVPIDPAVFATSAHRGTIVDSGTIMSYLSVEAYGPFLSALVASMPPFVKSFVAQGYQCFQISSSSARDVFPLVSLNFAGGASMILKYEDYLLQHFEFGLGIWCMGFQSNQGPTILGESVLKDKVIVYDLARQRLGWVDFNCSLSLNVSAPTSRSSAPLCPLAVISVILAHTVLNFFA